MCLISEPTGNRDLAERLARRSDHAFGALHAHHGDVGARWNADTDFECAREVTLADADDVGELGERHFRWEIRVDVLGGKVSLPAHEAAPTRARRAASQMAA
jgi:hypothetical protein